MGINQPATLYTIINDLERRIRDLETGSRIGNTAITSGSLVVKASRDGTTHGNILVQDGGNITVVGGGSISVSGGGGSPTGQGYMEVVADKYGAPGTSQAVFHAGAASDPSLARPDGESQNVTMISRDTGETAFVLWDPAPNSGGYQQYWSLNDRQGNTLVGDDAVSGQGLARPYLATGGGIPSLTSLWPSTTSSTYVTAYYQYLVKQHPQLMLIVGVTGDSAGSTGAAQFLVNGVSWGPVLSIDNTKNAQTIGPYPVSGAHMTTLNIELQIRSFNGTSTVRGIIGYAGGRES